jgi:PelA/Pel-15E family pectate lyase
MKKGIRALGLMLLMLGMCATLRAQPISENTEVKIKSEAAADLKEQIAQNMLIYQRNAGGWPKQVNDVKVDYTRALSSEQRAGIADDSFRNDATIDNGATVKEVRFLAAQYKITGNRAYLTAAEKGISYLLGAQYTNGGWPQFFPDTSGYRKQITYNDNAMVNVLSLLQDVSLGTHSMDVVNQSLREASKVAVARGIECILNTQVKVNGQLTAWCAQHDKNTLLPAKARSYELPSLSGMESATILEFLVRQKNPSERMKAAIVAGVKWLNAVQIKGYRYEDVVDVNKPKGYDRLLIPDAKSMVWARFYEIQTNEPFVSGRDGVKKANGNDLEYERRSGYAWYGTWPKQLIENSYPAWAAVNLTKAMSSK